MITPNMLKQLQKMVEKPSGPWCDSQDRRVHQGMLRTIWALRRHDLVKYVYATESSSAGWVVTETGRKLTKNGNNDRLHVQNT